MTCREQKCWRDALRVWESQFPSGTSEANASRAQLGGALLRKTGGEGTRQVLWGKKAFRQKPISSFVAEKERNLPA